MNCRFCKTSLTKVFLDLGECPPSNSYMTAEQLDQPEAMYELKVFVCERCFLVQIDEIKCAAEIFDHAYAYFSSYSTTWLAHARKYVDMAIDRFGLDSSSQVVEIASNDGYLLQYFLDRKIPVLGIEPAASTAAAARKKGVETSEEFFGADLARRLVQEGRAADLLLGNNVLAHVPDINDFVEGLQVALKPGGQVTMEFPHLLRLIEEVQFDTVYHEHFSYLSLHATAKIFAAHGLKIYDVEELPTHGGSLRIYAARELDAGEVSPEVERVLEDERRAGLLDINSYAGFQARVHAIRNDLKAFVANQKMAGKKIAAYGAAAKGNTLLNYCEIDSDSVEFVADRSPYKQGLFLPGSHIPIVDEREITETKPDLILILPWNLEDEIVEQLSYVDEWGAQFVTAIPHLKVLAAKQVGQ